MAYTSGTARDYRDMLAKIADFATTGLGADNWELIRGQRNPLARAFLDSSTDVGGKNPLRWDVSVAMGWGDYGDFDPDHDLNFAGWSDYTTNADSYLGFEAETTAQPHSYELKARAWNPDNVDHDEYISRQLNSWLIQYSSDGSSWTTAESESGYSWTQGQSRTFNIDQTTPITAKYWRLKVVSNNGSSEHQELGRLRFRDLAGDVISNAYSPEMIFKSEGFSGTQSIYTFIYLCENNVGDWYTFAHGSFLGYMEDELPENQVLSNTRYTPMWDSEIPFHLCINAQRILLSAKISTVSEFLYLGFYFPYASPEQYPYPYVNGGSTPNVSYRWSSTNYLQHSNIQDPSSYSNDLYSGGVFFFTPDEVWIMLVGSSYQSYQTYDYAYLFPVTHSAIPTTLHPNDDGTYTLVPYILYVDVSGEMITGELDGVYWVTGIDNAFEDIIQVDGDDYFVFQNTFNTGWSDYACMKLE